MPKITMPNEGLVTFRQDVHKLLRRRVLEAMEIVLEEELSEALGSSRYERSESRRGYRNGSEKRTITTSLGSEEIEIPRGRVFESDGETTEFQSELLPRYSRRTQAVDDAVLGVYLAGGNSRRIRKALEPLLGTKHLSKSAVSRVVSRLKDLFAIWSDRDLSEESYPILYLDGVHLKVRLAGRVVSVPVLIALGADESGNKRLVAMRICTSEAEVHWSSLIADLRQRGLRAPLLIIGDGHKGLQKAARAWPGASVQRCTVHKLQNLLDHCPVHARPELRRDYRAIITAEDAMAAKAAHAAFVKKWEALCLSVAKSLIEAGDALLTYFSFPKAMRKSLRSTNALENLNREFRRRTKTQASFPNEQGAITLLYGLIAFGQIRMRKINGHQSLADLMQRQADQAA
jgi:transposase-like protein